MVIGVHSQGFPLLIIPISNLQLCVEIGIFNPTRKTRVVGLFSTFRVGIRFAFVVLMLFAYRDIELNPGRKKWSSCYIFSVWHWNLSNITAHNFAKIDLLKPIIPFINMT